jgi:hypothetical protein
VNILLTLFAWVFFGYFIVGFSFVLIWGMYWFADEEEAMTRLPSPATLFFNWPSVVLQARRLKRSRRSAK